MCSFGCVEILIICRHSGSYFFVYLTQRGCYLVDVVLLLLLRWVVRRIQEVMINVKLSEHQTILGRVSLSP